MVSMIDKIDKIGVTGNENILIQDINHSRITINMNNPSEITDFFINLINRLDEIECHLTKSNNEILNQFKTKFFEFKKQTNSSDNNLQHLFELKKIHEKNLNLSETALAKWGDLAPAVLLHRREDALKEIERINQEIFKRLNKE